MAGPVVVTPAGASCDNNNLCSLSALTDVALVAQDVYEFVTGTVAAGQLYTITLFGINAGVSGDVVSTASDPSPPAATFGAFEQPACGGVAHFQPKCR